MSSTNLPPWSYTALSDYENCPKKYHHKYILKDLPRKETEAMKWGTTVHTAIENRLKGKGELPPEVNKYEPYIKAIKDLAMTMYVERKLGVNAAGISADFFAPDVWGRGKADVLLVHWDEEVGTIVDWKTGKQREDPAELEILSILASATLPRVKKWTGFYVWQAQDKIGDLHVLNPAKRLERVRATVGEMHKRKEANDWPAFDNPLCGWCPVRTCPNNRSN